MMDKTRPLICYCFGHTAEDIVADAEANGRSTIMTRIAAARTSGGCRCAQTHPQGR